MPAILPYLSDFDKQDFNYTEWYRVSIRDFGNGHKEGLITTYGTVSDLPKGWDGPDWNPERPEPDKDENQRRAARRAKCQVRKKCKAMGVDSLWTMTYKENVQDRELVLLHWKLFCERVRRVIPGWRYCAVLERQKRGALHIHVATHRLAYEYKERGIKVKSYDLFRSIWRSVTGGLGGSFNEKKAKGKIRIAASKVARYISKYVAKTFEEDGVRAEHEKRFFISQGVQLPPAVVMLFKREQLGDLIALLHSEVGATGVNSMFYSEDRGIFFIENFSPG